MFKYGVKEMHGKQRSPYRGLPPWTMVLYAVAYRLQEKALGGVKSWRAHFVLVGEDTSVVVEEDPLILLSGCLSGYMGSSDTFDDAISEFRRDESVHRRENRNQHLERIGLTP
jgi:hypothetical protein